MRTPGFDVRRFPAFGAIGTALLIFLYLPLAVVIIYAFNDSRLATAWGGFTTSWFGNVLADDDIRRVTFNSLQIAGVATLTSVLLATGAAVGLLSMRRAGHRIVMGLASLPMVLPEIVLAVAMLALFAFVKMPLGMTTVTIAHIAFCAPFALLPIRARLATLDPALGEAAADLGASRWKAFQRVTLPLLMPGIVAGALLAFIVSLDDFLITFFVSGPSATTLPLYIYSSIRVGLSPAINALSTILLCVSIAAIVASYRLANRKG